MRVDVDHRVVTWGALLDDVKYKIPPPVACFDESQSKYYMCDTE